MTPILVQLSPRRYLVLWLRYSGVTGGGVTGGTAAGGRVEWRWADIAFGPASYEDCVDWMTKQYKE